MPLGNLVASATRLPLESRPLIQQSSMFTYLYPAAAIPLVTNTSATPLRSDSLGLQPKLFQEFQPMGGVAPTIVEPPPAAPAAPAAPAPPLAPPPPAAP